MVSQLVASLKKTQKNQNHKWEENHLRKSTILHHVWEMQKWKVWAGESQSSRSFSSNRECLLNDWVFWTANSLIIERKGRGKSNDKLWGEKASKFELDPKTHFGVAWYWYTSLSEAHSSKQCTACYFHFHAALSTFTFQVSLYGGIYLTASGCALKTSWRLWFLMVEKIFGIIPNACGINWTWHMRSKEDAKRMLTLVRLAKVVMGGNSNLTQDCCWLQHVRTMLTEWNND